MSIFPAPVLVTAEGVAQAPAHDLSAHRKHYEMIGFEGLLDRVSEIGLQGFGGAKFPVARKWRAALTAGGGGIVVANGAESEPASGKDAALLQLRPHLVIDGLNATVHATRSTGGVVWLHQGATHSRTAIERALIERRAAGVIDAPIRIAEGPARFLTGESSTIVRALSGGPALPRARPMPAALSGVDGRPTVVHNVETLARVATVATGRANDGRRLLTLATATSRTVVDAWPSDRLASLTAGLVSQDISAALLGGYGGAWRHWHEVAAVPLSELDSAISAGIVVTLAQGACGVTATAEILRFLAASSARQCGPCLFGLADLTDVMQRVAAGRARRSDVATLRQISAVVTGRGACHHPDGAIRMLGSALEIFDREFGAHRRSQTCSRRHELGIPRPRAA